MLCVSAEGTRDVVVIGAGAAGIAFARSLHSAGRDITILETRDRVVGRVLTTLDFALFRSNWSLNTSTRLSSRKSC
ncbi:MAG: NAD(P)-binding protein [Rhizobiaceae bacterium]